MAKVLASPLMDVRIVFRSFGDLGDFLDEGTLLIGSNSFLYDNVEGIEHEVFFERLGIENDTLTFYGIDSYQARALVSLALGKFESVIEYVGAARHKEGM